jgi:hypothetical protein
MWNTNLQFASLVTHVLCSIIVALKKNSDPNGWIFLEVR